MSLDAAIRAVRAESLERSTGARVTRDRVLESVARSPRRRLHAVVAAVIASMFGASAFAWYVRTPSPPEPRAAVIVHAEATTAATETPARRERTVARIEPPVIDDENAAVIEHAQPPVVERQQSPAARAPAVAPSHEPAASRTPALTPTPSHEPAVPDGELALYALAHELHFRDRDLAAAVAAWDRYLAAAPTGRLAPEARFNRLVALVRLTRWDDAARALATVDPAFRPRDVERLRALIAAKRTAR